jgi:gluconolactonase
VTAGRLARPSELLPGRPEAIIDLQTEEGAAIVGGMWRTAAAEVVGTDFVDVGDDLGPSGGANRTYDVVPHAEGVDFDDTAWEALPPAETRRRLGSGRVSFQWYRMAVTIPERVGDLDPGGCTVVFEIVIDDYAEVWVDGRMPLAIGMTGGQVVAGFNAPNRVILTDDARPGQRFQIAVLGINGPISASPRNYIWARAASLAFHSAEQAHVGVAVPLAVERVDPALDAILGDPTLELVATGFEFTEGPVWSPDGGLLFSSPNTNVIYRWDPTGVVAVHRTNSGYSGMDIGAYHQPGSNGLTFDPQGRLVLCQHGNRRILRVEPHGNVTVLADAFEGKRLNSPNDLVCRSDGTLYFTDPPFGLPGTFDDPKKELAFSGVFAVDGRGVRLVSDLLEGPNGIALSPDERYLYVANWDPERKVVLRWELDEAGEASAPVELFDMTGSPGEDALDGLKVDGAGNLYVCGPGGIWILTADGVHLGTLRSPEAPHNLAWGDDDARTLYITAISSIYRLRLQIPGVRP